jgi:AAA family ATP:ADP antiporter
MFTRCINIFFPDLKPEETRKFGLLAIAGFFVIGAYWLLRLLKNTIFYKIAFPVELGWPAGQGALYQPTAKFWSPFVVLVVVLIYSKLVDLFKKHQLFYIICSFYGILFAGIAAVVGIKELYGPQALGKDLLALTGWINYFSVETFGSLVVALFWSFSNSISTTDAAKRGFPFIVAFMQIGAIGGSALCLFTEQVGALWPFLLATSAFMFFIVGMIYYFMLTTPADELVGNKAATATEKKKEGFFEGFFSGLTLLATRPYLLGVLIISTFYEVCMQIVDYQLHVQASNTPDYASAVAFNRFEGILGVSANALSFLIALLGTSYIIKRFGVRISLAIYPIAFTGVIACLLMYFYTAPTPTQLLWATFAAFMIVKALSYAINNPLKEMMYIPTSKDAKFKSKGWIDMFGSRFAKAGGGQINNLFKHNLGELMVYGTFFSFGLIGIWLAAAFYVGRKNQQLIHDGKIIE